MRVLFVGDIVGSPGRQIVRDRLADIVAQKKVDLVIANGENSAAGFGITPRLADEFLHDGIDVLTGGNHSWDRREIMDYLPHEPRLLRPANFPDGSPGSGLFCGTAKKRRQVRGARPGTRSHSVAAELTRANRGRGT